MFCPKCATQNLDGASYCRSCGANVSLVPQALSGHLPQATDVEEGGRGYRRHGRRALTLDNAFKNAFMGLAFMIVAIALAFSRVGTGWWFWMLIPAFSMMATGLAQYIRIKEREKRAFLPGGISQPSLQQRSEVETLPARNTGELAPPPSVTEGTTRHLGTEAPTRHFTGDAPK
jgi:hypothetical protein